MRLLLVNYEYPPVGGGAATATRALASELTNDGHSVVVLTGAVSGLPPETPIKGVTVYRLRHFRARIDRCSLFAMLCFAVRGLAAAPVIIRRHQIEAAISFFTFPSGPIGLLAWVFRKVPYVVSLRGGDVPGNEPELRYIHWALTPIRRAILRRSLAIIANSEGLARLSERADPFPVQVIRNGVDTAFFRPALSCGSGNGDGRRLRLLFVGRFHRQKNLRLLFEQLARLPPKTFELQLVGDGPLQADLRRYAADLGIDETIKWRGWLPRAELLPVYHSADCLVNPSRYEGMPNAVLEAMACGLVVVASNVPGNDVLVRDGETGYLFDLCQPDSLSEVLNRLIERPLRCRQLGANARTRAEQEFSWYLTTRQYLQLFASHRKAEKNSTIGSRWRGRVAANRDFSCRSTKQSGPVR